MRTDASRALSHQDLNPTDIDRISFGRSFVDVRRALDKWEAKTYPNRPKYGHGHPCHFGTGVLLTREKPKTEKEKLSKQEKNKRRMARLKRQWDKMPPEERQKRRDKINARNRANRAKKKGVK